MNRMWSKQLLYSRYASRYYCVKTRSPQQYTCKLLIVGGGAGGCSVAARLSRVLRNNDVIVLEPSCVHYYQPLYTLVAAGIKKFSDCHRPQKAVLPPHVRWLQDHAKEFDPCNNTVRTNGGDTICYQYMVVAVGLVNDYDKIPGLRAALDDCNSGVSTIYAPEYCQKTWTQIQQFSGGHAVFTFPYAGSKCSGAAQKIMYLADDYWRKRKRRELTNITYMTGSNSIFGVPKYSRALERLAARRGFCVNYCYELIEVNRHAALFQDLAGQQIISLPYNLLHVTPPMSPPLCLQRCQELATPSGYLDVDHHTLRHNRHHNVFGVGDCLATPNSKTAAAVAEQSSVVEKNLYSAICGDPLNAKYRGYGACPLLTSYKTGILAEFLYDKKLCETFPFDQSKERRIFYHLNTKIMPYLYWEKLLKGKWNGPEKMRKLINPFGK